MHLTGFASEIPTPAVHVALRRAETHGDLFVQALGSLLAISGKENDPIAVHIPSGRVQRLVTENSDLLPTGWSLSQEPLSEATIAYCRNVFQRQRQKLVDIEAASPEIPAGTRPRVIVAADAAIRHSTDGLLASAGWVIAAMKPGEIRVGHCQLAGDSKTTDEYEMLAIEQALIAMSSDPLTKSRRTLIGGVLMLTDNSSAHAILTGKQESSLQVVRRIAALANGLKVNIEFKWVKGHHLNPWNIAADELAALEHVTWPATRTARKAAKRRAREAIVKKLRVAIEDGRDRLRAGKQFVPPN